MDNLSGISVFVCAAEKTSFVDAGRLLGVSASAVGKTVTRLETRLGVRLFHRNTRSMTLTAEGQLFLQRCHLILAELAAAERELSDIRNAPQGRLRVSLPLIGTLLLPILAEFINSYPAIQLDIAFSDRKVDLIDEGFDAAIRIGDTEDSGLLRKSLGAFRRSLVASPEYIKKAGSPKSPLELLNHTCLLYRFPSTGKVEPWPISGWDRLLANETVSTVSCNSVEALTYLAVAGQGIACLPDFEINAPLARNALLQLPLIELPDPRQLTILWPPSKKISPKLRVCIDLLSARLR
jgi:DNA-binding transcriptional LysR family regulator